MNHLGHMSHNNKVSQERMIVTFLLNMIQITVNSLNGLIKWLQ